MSPAATTYAAVESPPPPHQDEPMIAAFHDLDAGDDDFDDLYSDVNVGGGTSLFFPTTTTAVSSSYPPLETGPDSSSSPHPPPPPPPPPPRAPSKPEFQPKDTALVLNGGGGGVGGGDRFHHGDHDHFHSGTLFVGELHWWTTDADLEAEFGKYGQLKEVRIFCDKVTGKSKGYSQVDFVDPASAAAAKDALHGLAFHGRQCVVSVASPDLVRRIGDMQVRKQQVAVKATEAGKPLLHKDRVPGPVPVGGNYGKGAGNFGSRGTGRNRIGGRSGSGRGRGILGNGGMIAPTAPPPQPLGANGFNPGFDPTGFCNVMQGMVPAGYGGFPTGPTPGQFNGMMPGGFPPNFAPHMNPMFFGRGMTPGRGGMWPEQGMGFIGGGWGGEWQGNFGKDAMLKQQYGEGNYGMEKESGMVRDQMAVLDNMHERERDVGFAEDRLERRYRDDRYPDCEMERDREREREKEKEMDRGREKERERERESESERERERYRGKRDHRDGEHHRYRERESERGDRERRGSSRARSRSRDDGHYTKRRH